MGNTKSSDNYKITNQLPPSYDEIYIKKIEKVDPLLPIMPEFVKAKQELFKTAQLRAYEKQLKIATTHIIKNLNIDLPKILIHDYATYTAYISIMDRTNYLKQQYKSAELDILYLQKEFDFICKMYSGFDIKILADLPSYKKLQFSLKSN